VPVLEHKRSSAALVVAPAPVVQAAHSSGARLNTVLGPDDKPSRVRVKPDGSVAAAKTAPALQHADSGRHLRRSSVMDNRVVSPRAQLKAMANMFGTPSGAPTRPKKPSSAQAAAMAAAAATNAAVAAASLNLDGVPTSDIVKVAAKPKRKPKRKAASAKKASPKKAKPKAAAAAADGGPGAETAATAAGASADGVAGGTSARPERSDSAGGAGIQQPAQGAGFVADAKGRKTSGSENGSFYQLE
jgi:hypothetical protein